MADSLTTNGLAAAIDAITAAFSGDHTISKELEATTLALRAVAEKKWTLIDRIRAIRVTAAFTAETLPLESDQETGG